MRNPKPGKIVSGVLACMLAMALSPAAAVAAPPGGGGTPPGGGTAAGSGGGGADTATFDYTGTYSGALVADGTSVTSSSESYTAQTADQNAALSENGGTLTIDGDTFTKSGDDTDGDNCNFYGCNSILLAVNSASTAYVKDSTLSATSQGSNGIFATDGATVYAENDTISTTSSNSRGLDATYDGNIIADYMDITTQADHCAAIATDRGGGDISATNSTLSTAGSGSPLLYSTGDIEVDNCSGTATGSQIAGMEGLNTILIYNSNLSSTNDAISGSDPMKDGVIIYQSTSGDADTSTGEAADFEASASTLSSSISSGAMFYLTNTTADIVLSDTTLDFDSDAVNLITAEGNDSNNWGTAGSNGATVRFTGLGETLSGNIDVDTISTLELYLLDGTTYTGATTISTNSVNTSATSAPLTMNIGSDSSWIVTSDSKVTNLNIASGGALVDASGDTANVVDASGSTLVDGTGSVTVTVTGTYSTTVSTDDTNALSTDFIDRTAFDDYYATSTTFGENAGSASTVGGDVETFSGVTRFDTASRINAAELSKGSYAGVIVACGDDGKFPDALGGTALAGLLDYPIVLSDATTVTSYLADSLDDLAMAAGGKLDVIVIGDENSISSTVESALDTYDSDGAVTRLGGADRYETNELIYRYGEDTVGWSKDECILTIGTGFADALCASPYAAARDIPIFLVGSSVDSDAQAIIGQFQTKVVLGDENGISADIYDALDCTERLGGADRYATANLIIAYELENGMSLQGCGVATGLNFPDALASGFYLGENGSVLGLVNSSSPASYSYLKTLLSNDSANISTVRFFGGTSSVGNAARNAIYGALGWNAALNTVTAW